MATAAQLPPIAGDPYLAARQEYSDRYAHLAAGKRNWQVAALIFAILAGLASATALIQVRQVKLIPYVVVEDRLGQVVSVPDVLRPSAASIDLEAITRTTIEAFIHGIRSVYADPVAQYDAAQAAKSHLIGAANHYVGEWFEANNPFKIAHTHCRGHHQHHAAPRQSAPHSGLRLSGALDRALLRQPGSQHPRARHALAGLGSRRIGAAV
jgi:type IV secretory pathway TrbF-like protein